MSLRITTIVADVSYILAGITLIVSFTTYFLALTVHSCDPRDGEPCTGDNEAIIYWGKQGSHLTYQVATSFMFLEGFFWCLGGILSCIVFVCNNVASLAVVHCLIGAGGFFFACSAGGSPANVISLRYLIPMAITVDDMGYQRAPSPVSFADVCPYFGIFCFMTATSISIWGVRGLPKANIINPFYGVLCYFIGAWLIGVFVLYGPMLAGGWTAYEDLTLPPCAAMAKDDPKCLLDMPVIAWTWTHFIAVVGSISLTTGAVIFATLDKIWLLRLPEQISEPLTTEM